MRTEVIEINNLYALKLDLVQPFNLRMLVFGRDAFTDPYGRSDFDRISIEVVDSLAISCRGLKMAICTNIPTNSEDGTLGWLSSAFHGLPVLKPTEKLRPKPYPDMYYRLQELYDVAPQEMGFVDLGTGALPGLEEAGVKTLFFWVLKNIRPEANTTNDYLEQ